MRMDPMLHLFVVNQGRMVKLKVEMAMKKVIELKAAVKTICGIEPKKQVMLINGGQALDDANNVCSYNAGIATNPIYVFDVSKIEKESFAQTESIVINNDWEREVHPALRLSPSYETIVTRTKLAMRIHESTRRQVATLSTMVNTQHLVFQSWQAAVMNLNNLVKGFDRRVPVIHQRCKALFDEAVDYNQTLDGFEETIDLLGRIPLLPALLSDADANALTDSTSSELTLLDWIELKCRKVKLATLLSECRQQTNQLKSDKFQQLMEDCCKVSEHANSAQMRDVSRTKKTLHALDSFLQAAQQHLADQKGLSDGFRRNEETMRKVNETQGSLNNSSCEVFSESHVNQLRRMENIATQIRAGCNECNAKKNTQEKHFHQRLRWLHAVQRNIATRDREVTLFQDRLLEFRHKVDFLSRVKRAPEFYFALLRECVRRRSFSRIFTQWTDGVLTTSRVARDRENMKRKNFKSMIGDHFIQKLFPGFSDRPPLVAKRPLRRFDSGLPAISSEDLRSLTSNFPQFTTEEIEVAEFPDPSTFPWQLTYSTSTKRTLTLQASSVTSSINSVTTNIEASVGSPTEGFLKDVKTETNNLLLGGFVTSSVHQSDDVTSTSPPTLPTDGNFTIGSPESGEFFSIAPFVDDSSPRLQSFITLTPPDKETFTSEMPTITEDDVALSSNRGIVIPRATSQSQLTTGSASDDEMFHSISSDLNKEKANTSQFLVEERNLRLSMKQQDEQIELLKKKHESELQRLQRGHDDVIAEHDRRWAESRAELDVVIGQLENERHERKQAWEKEGVMTEQCEDLKKKSALLSEESSSLRSEILLKSETIAELRSELEKHRSSCEIELATAVERSEREMWEAKNAFDAERETLTGKVDKLSKELKGKEDDLSSAEDRIQELETELSDVERQLIVNQRQIEELKEEVVIHQGEIDALKSLQDAAKVEVEDAEERARDAEEQMRRHSERSDSLKAMLAGYELQLEDMRATERLLREQKEEASELTTKLSLLEGHLVESESTLRKQEREMSRLTEEVARLTATNAANDEAFAQKLSEVNSSHEQTVLDLKTEADERLNKMFEANKKKTKEAEERHKLEVERITEEHENEIEDLKKSNRCELDEMQVDHIHALVEAQKKRDSLQEDLNLLNDEHKKSLDGLVAAHNEEVERLKKELDDALQSVSSLQSKLLPSPSTYEPMMTSSMMSSSNDDEPDSRQPVDDVMMTSFKEELEKEKEALKNSFKRKEESATKRRQVMFNSAIQHLTMVKDVEIERLKDRLSQAESMMSSSTSVMPVDDVTSSMTSSTARIRDKIAIANFQRDDVVLVVFEAKYNHYIVFTVGHTIHFIHNDSINQLNLKPPETGKNWLLARFVDKQYCQARKEGNRFKIPIDTKFFRVFILPVNKPAT